MTQYLFSVHYGQDNEDVLDLLMGYYVIDIKGARIFAMHAIDTLDDVKSVDVAVRDIHGGRRIIGTAYYRGNGINRTHIWLRAGDKTAYAVRKDGTVDKGAPFGIRE